MSDFFIQGIGWIGTLAYLLSYQVKSNRGLYFLCTIGSLAFTVQFMLMGAYTGSITLLISLAQTLMLMRYNEWAWVRWKGWVVIFNILFLIVLVFTWDGPMSLLATVPSLVSTVTMWTNNAGIMRLNGLLVGGPCWIVYDIILGSWAGIATEIITVASSLLSIYRFGWKNLIAEDSEFSK